MYVRRHASASHGAACCTPEDAKKKMDQYAEQRTTLQHKIQWTLTLLPVLLFAGLGLFRWWRREASRSSLSL